MIDLTKSAKRQTREAAESVRHFAKWFVGVTLRPYQAAAAQAIVDSVFARDGLTIVIIFSRQSGKDEMLAIVFLFLMFRFMEWGIEMVCAQPTFKPQTITAMERMKKRGMNFGRKLGRTAGYIFRLGAARMSYFSAEPTANVVSATGRLIVLNEAQDMLAAVVDGKFGPMGANENATRVYSGTRWIEETPLERELKIALELQKRDGRKRVFMADSDQVRKCNPWYGKYVDAEIKKLGRQHPLIKSQYFNELVDAKMGMFPARRLALMLGDQEAQAESIPGHLYAMTIDVGGQDEALMNLDGMGNPGRDYVTTDILDVDLSSLETLQAPIYRCVMRDASQGVNHVTVFGGLCALIDAWNVQYIVIDATGVGEGLWGMLVKKYPTRVIAVKFTQQAKSEIGYAFIGVVETGRFRDCVRTEEVRMQYEKCQSEILIGPAKTMRWGVKDGTRDTSTGLLVHDDFLLADSLVTELDKLEWKASVVPGTSEPVSPLPEMSRIKPVTKNETLRKMSRIR